MAINRNALKLDDHKIEYFESGREMGMTVEECCELIKVSKKTAYNWKNLGEEVAKYCDENNIEYSEHHDYLYYKFSLAFKASAAKLNLRARKNLMNLAEDRMMTDKDGVYKIDKPGSVQANIAILNNVSKDWREKNKESDQVVQKTFIGLQPIEGDKTNILESLRVGNNKQMQDLRKDEYDGDEK